MVPRIWEHKSAQPSDTPWMKASSGVTPRATLSSLRQRKSRARFSLLDEVRAFLQESITPPPIILLFCGFQPEELLALRIEDVEAGRLRIGEANKEKEKGQIASAKAEPEGPTRGLACRLTSLGICTRGLRTCLQGRSKGIPPSCTAYRIGNFLKHVMKPIAKAAGIADFDFRAMRSTASALLPGARHGQGDPRPNAARRPVNHPPLLSKSSPESPNLQRSVMKQGGKFSNETHIDLLMKG